MKNVNIERTVIESRQVDINIIFYIQPPSMVQNLERGFLHTFVSKCLQEIADKKDFISVLRPKDSQVRV